MSDVEKIEYEFAHDLRAAIDLAIDPRILVGYISALIDAKIAEAIASAATKVIHPQTNIP